MKSFIKVSFIILTIFMISLPLKAQTREEVKLFFDLNAQIILEMAHKNSTMISSNVIVFDSDESNYEYKVVIEINYKGFVNNHIIKAYIYIENFPRKFIWGADTNSFSINNAAEAVLEELKVKWSEYEF